MSKMVLVQGKYVSVAETFEEYVKTKKFPKTTFNSWVKDKRFNHPKSKNKVLFDSLPKDEQKRIRDRWRKNPNKNVKLSFNQLPDPYKDSVRKSWKKKVKKEKIEKRPEAYKKKTDPNKAPLQTVPKSVTNFNKSIKEQYGLNKIPEGSFLDFSKEVPNKEPEFFTGTEYKDKSFINIKNKKVSAFHRLPKSQQEDIAKKYKYSQKYTPERLTQAVPKEGQVDRDKKGKIIRKIESVVYNPGYNPKYPADSWYCRINIKTRRADGSYGKIKENANTLEYARKRNRIKFLVMKQATKNWDTMNKRLTNVFKKEKPGDKNYACAGAFGIQMATGARIGNPNNISNGVFGASTLQKRHFTFNTDGSITLQYKGKDGVDQKKKITKKHKDLILALKQLYKKAPNKNSQMFTYGKDASSSGLKSLNFKTIVKDYNFESAREAKKYTKDILNAKTDKQILKTIENYDFDESLEDAKEYREEILEDLGNVDIGATLITNTDIGSKAATEPGFIKDVLKVPINSHCVRHVWGSRIFTAELQKINPNKIPFQGDKVGNPSNSYVSKVFKEFKKSVEPVTVQLGNNYAASVGRYIDPELIIKYFDTYGVKPQFYPTGIKQIMTRSGIIIKSSNKLKKWDFSNWKVNNMNDFGTLLASFNYEEEPVLPVMPQDGEEIEKLTQ